MEGVYFDHRMRFVKKDYQFLNMAEGTTTEIHLEVAINKQ
jgi:hypothetical protein